MLLSRMPFATELSAQSASAPGAEMVLRPHYRSQTPLDAAICRPMPPATISLRRNITTGSPLFCLAGALPCSNLRTTSGPSRMSSVRISGDVRSCRKNHELVRPGGPVEVSQVLFDGQKPLGPEPVFEEPSREPEFLFQTLHCRITDRQGSRPPHSCELRTGGYRARVPSGAALGLLGSGMEHGRPPAPLGGFSGGSRPVCRALFRGYCGQRFCRQ